MVKKTKKSTDVSQKKETKVNGKEITQKTVSAKKNQKAVVKDVYQDEENLDPNARIEVKKALVEPLIAKGKKLGYLTYEEIMEFSHKHQLSDQDTNNLMRIFDKENIELLMQEELDANAADLHDFEKEDEPLKSKNLKEKIENSLDLDVDEDVIDEEDDVDVEDEERVIKEAVSSAQIADGVKCYLRDIGKIPLLNKKTESIIAEQIASGKSGSIESISKFPFMHKEFVSIGDRIQKGQFL